MVALVATIHVFKRDRQRERFGTCRQPPSASQDVDARDKPEHDEAPRRYDSVSRMISSFFHLLRGARVWPGITIPDGGIRFSTDI